MSDKEPLLNTSSKFSIGDDDNKDKPTVISNISDWYRSFQVKKDDEKYTELQGDTESDPKDKPVGFFRLFRFAKRPDFIAMFISFCTTLIHSFCFLSNFILFGRLTGLFATKSFGLQREHPYSNLTTLIPTNHLYTSPPNSNVLNSTSAVIFHKEVMTVIHWYLIIGGILFVSTIIEYYFWETTAIRQTFRMRVALLRSIIQRKMGYMDANLSKQLNNQVFDLITKIEKGINYELILLIAMNLTTAGGFIGSLIINWKLALVMLCLVPLVMIGSVLFSKFMAKETINELTAYSKAERIAQEVFSSVRTVLSLNGSKFEQRRYEEQLAPTRSYSIRKTTIFGASLGWMQFLSYLAYAIAFIFGTLFKSPKDANYMRIDDVLIVGTVFANCLLFFNYIGPALHGLSEARGAAAPVFRLIDEEGDTDVNEQGVLNDKSETSSEIHGDIQFNNVDFEYPSRQGAKVLRDLSLVARVGQTTALVGSSGCGKSTCISLLLRYYEPSAGQITIAGRPLTDWNVRHLRQRIGVVSQEPVLFGTTIYENIRFGKLDATRTEIEQAARESNAHNFIMKLPNKYETLVGERGIQLSGGEKQRIALARALIKQPTILLLDEATSALDNINEKLVQEALDRACKGRTTIVIAHRLSTIQNADQIYVLGNGSVIEQGEHETLMKKEGGIYQTMVKRQQTEKFKDETSEAMSTQQAMEEDEKIASERSRTASDGQAVEIDNARAKSTRKGFSTFRIFELNKPEWAILLAAGIASIVCGTSGGVFAILLAKIIESFKHYAASDRLRSVLIGSFTFLGLGILLFLARCFQYIAFGLSGSRLVERIRKKYFQSLLRQEVAYFDQSENSSGAITTRLNTGISSIENVVNVRLGTACEAVAIFIFGIVLGFVISWQIALIIFSAVAVMVLLFISETYLRARNNQKLNEHMEQANSLAVETIQNMRTVKQLSMENEVLRQYSDLLHKRFRLGREFNIIYAVIFGLYAALHLLVSASIYWCALALLENGQITPSQIIKIITFALFALEVFGFIYVISLSSGAFMSATETLFDLFDRKPAIDNGSSEGQELTDFHGDIQFVDVKFAYPTRSASLVLNKFQLCIKPSQRVALVGASGCGKSTIIQLLERFYDVTNGQLLINGTDIRKFNLHSLRSQLGLVGQEPVLFDLTIAENIKYGLENVPMEEVVSAARRANIHEFVESLPQGYETKVGAKGSFLSGGEKQRIAIARVLIRRPKVLLLDEATSAMDSQNEQIIQATLDQVQMEDSSRTSLAIAHRLSTVRSSDMICVLDRGRIVESGTHTELVENRGIYFEMLNQNGA